MQNLVNILENKTLIIELNDKYVYFKTSECAIIIKVKKCKFMLCKKSIIFDSNDHVFIFTNPAVLNLSSIEIVEKIIILYIHHFNTT